MLRFQSIRYHAISMQNATELALNSHNYHLKDTSARHRRTHPSCMICSKTCCTPAMTFLLTLLWKKDKKRAHRFVLLGASLIWLRYATLSCEYLGNSKGICRSKWWLDMWSRSGRVTFTSLWVSSVMTLIIPKALKTENTLRTCWNAYDCWIQPQGSQLLKTTIFTPWHHKPGSRTGYSSIVLPWCTSSLNWLNWTVGIMEAGSKHRLAVTSFWEQADAKVLGVTQ